jgi:hypothetical protein
LLIGTKTADLRANQHLWRHICGSDGSLRSLDFLTIEAEILDLLHFDVRLTTPLVFLRCYFRVLIEKCEERSRQRDFEKVTLLFLYCALSFEACRVFTAEQIAVTSLFLAAKVLKIPAEMDIGGLAFDTFPSCLDVLFDRISFVVGNEKSDLMVFFHPVRALLARFVTDVTAENLLRGFP